MAASRGDSDLVKALTQERAEATDHRGRSALHLASSKGYTDIVSRLVPEDDPDMCTARDVDGRNPLHLAAIYGRVEVLELLVQRCPHAAEARADRGETILHLCFKYNHKEALELLLDIAKLEELVNAKDDDGNTLLHLVVADQNTQDLNLEIVKRLLECGRIDASANNSQGETPLDIALEFKRKSHQKLEGSTTGRSKIATQQVKTLIKKGAKRGEENRNMEWLTSKTDALMVVASLTATIAFQAGVNPPGGVWQDSADGHRAGEAVMAYNNPDSYPIFLKLNAVSLVGSLSIILFVVIRGDETPFMKKIFMWQLLVTMWMTVVAITISYVLAITVVTPNKDSRSLPNLKIGVLLWSLVMFIYTVTSLLPFLRKNVAKNRKMETGKNRRRGSKE